MGENQWDEIDTPFVVNHYALPTFYLFFYKPISDWVSNEKIPIYLSVT